MAAPPVVYDRSNIVAITLAANTQTDVTNGSIGDAQAGTYSLKLTNDTDASVTVSQVALTSGADPTAANKIQPAFTIEPRGWWLIQPLTLGSGWRLFVTATGGLSATLVGQKGA
ncbi:hypothetical protein [Methylobacterium sp. CCH5-D2]|uniref:hypothetical protein n=1 Tax=Methylobacterium sp. CCH5-D2 TaxID=1768765 RepID=UPI00082B36C8|nr:hypothetical protein [Methylobacterium sp. CCH5-D2]